ncbi:MAG: LamG domain-containing protein [Lentisphaeria bacterium]
MTLRTSALTVLAVTGLLAAAVPAQAALVRQWLFDETGTTTTAVDATGNQNGTLVNFNFDETSGWENGALRFDGVSDAVAVGSNTLGASYTITAWINADAFTSTNTNHDQNVIFAQYGTPYPAGRMSFMVNPDGYLTSWEGGPGGSGSASGTTHLSTGQWYFVALSNSNKSAVGYLNGNVEFDKTFVYDPQDLDNTIGSLDTSLENAGNFDGLIKDVRIYDTALTQAEIQAVMVPEPAALGLLALGGLALLRRRR